LRSVEVVEVDGVVVNQVARVIVGLLLYGLALALVLTSRE
jgi:hypothetical protein